MNRAQFTIAKVFHDEDRLATLSTTSEGLNEDLRDKSVALVGNARSLSHNKFGQQIDEADIVIRINTSPMPNPESHGRRTTWIATSVPIPPAVMAARAAQRILWMTSKRKRLPWRLAKCAYFYMHPAFLHHELIAELGFRPTTGVMVLNLLKSSPMRSVNIFGFDFFSSLSLSGARTTAQVPHNFEAERKWTEQLLIADQRFSLKKLM